MQRDEAVQSVLDYVKKEFGFPSSSDEIVIADTLETTYGWFFRTDTRCYLESGDECKALMGNGPVLVLKRDGTLIPFSSALDVELARRFFENSLASNVSK